MKRNFNVVQAAGSARVRAARIVRDPFVEQVAFFLRPVREHPLKRPDEKAMLARLIVPLHVGIESCLQHFRVMLLDRCTNFVVTDHLALP